MTARRAAFGPGSTGLARMNTEAAGCEVIAEAGVNHNGRDDFALSLVEAGAQAGADAIKFQTFDPQALVARGARTAGYQSLAGCGEDQRAMLDGLVLCGRA